MTCSACTIDDLRASLSSARGSIVSLEIANKDLLEALSNKAKEIDGTKTHIGELNEKLANKDKELEKFKVRNELLTVELNDLKAILTKSQEAVTADQIETQDLKTKSAASEAALLEAHHFNEKLMKDVAQLQTDLGKAEALQEAGTQELAKSREEVFHLHMEVQDAKSALEAATTSVRKNADVDQFNRMSQNQEEVVRLAHELSTALHDLGVREAESKHKDEQITDLKAKETALTEAERY